MKRQESRYFDPEIMNLDGGLFASSHPLAPVDLDVMVGDAPLAPPLATGDARVRADGSSGPGPAPSSRTGARARSRRARILSFTAGASAIGLLALGMAAASQMPVAEGPPRAPEPTDATLALSAPASPPHGPFRGVESAPAAAAPPAVAPSPAGSASPAEPVVPREPARGAAAPAKSLAAGPAIATPPVEGPTPASAPIAPAPAPPPSGLEAFAPEPRELSRPGAAIAIAAAARNAGACTAPDDPRTTMPVRVVFAPSGKVTSASLQGGPFLGTATGSCIATALHSARVAPFDGAPTAVTTTIRIR